MAYQALYRKYRPSYFSDVAGQDHIVRALRNQIESGRVGHAYLFCGTRGTGKTSVAKIFARAVNCEAPVNGEPCGKCASCTDIAINASMNVLEIDAASNNGVDNIRDIRDSVEYTPTTGKYRVFIIDEAHMLTGSAFNALLKTLEEPPEYVIFILATTNPGKIPATIISRCQRYDFRRLSAATIQKRLREITDAEGINAEDRALRYLSYAADGAMRDALSLLEQCVSFFMGDVLTYEKVLEILGAMDNDTYREMVLDIHGGDTVKAVKMLDASLMAGKDIELFFSDLVWHLRNVMLVKSGDDIESITDTSGENAELLKKEAQTVDMDSIMRYIRIFSELLERFRTATQKRVLAEAAVIKACRPSMETDIGSLLSRLSILEQKLAGGAYKAPAPAEKEKDPAETEEDPAGASYYDPAMFADDASEPEHAWTVRKVKPEAAPEAEAPVKEEPAAVSVPEVKTGGGSTAESIIARWDRILENGTGPMASMLRGAEVTADGDNRIIIRMERELSCSYFSDRGHADMLRELIKTETGAEPELLFLKKGESEDVKKKLLDPKKINFKDIKIKYET
ncbi:MAG: DNA polymerase III subunit gamma/tau [Lachnospiraceae bacterium]|nr:DNA polymerase III subunit gamma/tau [Lachnospiraceae bacterium]